MGYENWGVWGELDRGRGRAGRHSGGTRSGGEGARGAWGARERVGDTPAPAAEARAVVPAPACLRPAAFRRPAPRLRRILLRLEGATRPGNMVVPGY